MVKTGISWILMEGLLILYPVNKREVVNNQESRSWNPGHILVTVSLSHAGSKGLLLGQRKVGISHKLCPVQTLMTNLLTLLLIEFGISWILHIRCYTVVNGEPFAVPKDVPTSEWFRDQCP